MSKFSTLTPIAAVLAVSVAGMAHAAENPFALKQAAGIVVADAGKEGSCGAKKTEGSCGAKKEAKCGADKAKKEGKCGEGKCGANKKKAEAEGKCGADKAAAKEGSCGAKK
jgi:uncharacterized low-complexity protein